MDPYHSRTRPQWEAADREDPVVWGDPPGPLAADQLEAYRRDGFLVLREWLSDRDVAKVRTAAEALADRVDPADERVVYEPDNDTVRSVFEMHRLSDTLASLVAHERLAGVARQILGDAVYVHQSRINFKKGFDGRAFDWHSDFETWHVEDGMPRMRALSCAVMLSENTEFNGPLMLVPRSHRTYVRCVGETPPEHYKQSLRKQEYGVPDAEALRMLIGRGGLASAKGPAGSVVFFDCNTMHGSAGNLTPFPRDNAFIVYNATSNALVAPFGGQEPRPGFIAAREARPLAA